MMISEDCACIRSVTSLMEICILMDLDVLGVSAGKTSVCSVCDLDPTSQYTDVKESLNLTVLVAANWIRCSFLFCFCSDENFEYGGMGPDGDEEEEDEEIDQRELQRRKERLEREQWLREQVCVKKNAMCSCLCACVLPGSFSID